MSGIVLGSLLVGGCTANGGVVADTVRQQTSMTIAGTADGQAGNTLGLDMMTTSTVATGLFGSVAFPFKPGALARWRQIEGAAAHLSPKDCDEQAACRTRLNMLRDAVSAGADKSLLQKIEAINVAVNRLIKYSKDVDVHGKLDYWATPSEILATGKGDCEDYAILKLAALRQAGVKEDRMTLVVLRESRRNFYHAVLTIAVGGKNYVLDNMRDAVLTDRQLPEYQALYSLGSERAWIHGYKRGSEYAMQKRPASLEAVQPGEGIPVSF
ncbi:transglutaminase-like cysteine peptidase [Shinella sp. G-2]|uniref:transglutaminase-like cysteine peptidase n=1 Tax=Shinella sp. G-2 TaxID=3133141 RepID=UPI003CFD5CDF